MRILFFGSDFPLIKQGSAPVKIQKRENFSLLFVQRVDKVLNFLYNKGGKDRKLHKLCRRYAVCFRYFCDVSYPQLRELKGAEPMFQYVLDDVSYPQLRELKVLCQAQPAGQHGCILPAAAGIESAGPAGPGTGGPDVSYPQLRELKRQTALPFRPIPPNVSYPQLRELKQACRR